MASDFAQPLSNISLPVIDYNGLIRREIGEIQKLIEATTELGFFYLKLDERLDPDPMFRLAESVFQMPLDDKLPYEMDGKNGVYYGYKPASSLITDKYGTPDTIEFWNISKDELLVRDGTKYPKTILDAKDIVKSFMIASHEIISVILDILPDVSLGAHTDFGSVTILFNRLYGLQVLSMDKEWLYVSPLPGHAIVNLGDAMVKLSGGRLSSNTHRVVTAPDVKEVTDRFSVVYFARPENQVPMKNLLNDENEANDTSILTAQEWIARRVKNFLVANYTNEKIYKLSRGTEVNCEV